MIFPRLDVRRALRASIRALAIVSTLACGALFSSDAHAVATAVDAQITSIEVSYMPTSIQFFLSAGTAACPAGTRWEYASTNTETVKAMHSTLLAGLLSGRRMTVYYDSAAPRNAKNNCDLRFLYINNN